ncbi:MAG: bifunctional demethylmenaquinone methyltransferase/2-methoxy-6-polyprenyl-1,4-benzoquinol methylase UbiE [Coriobacteriia bacterium]|nr:bifunctional demethylmenaquinone methyltransferase/2-methoxy-6-polyprenyl-1,4-benzoquinol methylase UbiE [Coriobacteriia bacterium]
MPRGSGEGRPAAGQPTAERVHGIFSGLARRYDLFNIVSSFGLDRRWRRKLVRVARISPGDRVLDLCAGTGDVALAVARRSRAAEVVATDFVEEMLAVARRKAEAYRGSAKLGFSLADAQNLPFEDDSFDVATVAFGIRNLPDRAANFREVRRVLRPGGRYVVLEFSRPPRRPFRALYHFYLGRVVPLVGAVLAGDRGSFVYLNESIRAFPYQEALAAELRSAGFRDVEWANLTGGIVALHVATK